MNNICILVEINKETKTIVKSMVNANKKGSVHGVGEFCGHILLNLACKVGILGNLKLVEHVTIAPTTTTFKRLKK